MKKIEKWKGAVTKEKYKPQIECLVSITNSTNEKGEK